MELKQGAGPGTVVRVTEERAPVLSDQAVSKSAHRNLAAAGRCITCIF